MRLGETWTVSKGVAVLAVLDPKPRESVMNRFYCQRGRLSRMRRKPGKKTRPPRVPPRVRTNRTPLCPLQVPHQRCRHRKVSWGFLPLIGPEAAGGELVGEDGRSTEGEHWWAAAKWTCSRRLRCGSEEKVEGRTRKEKLDIWIEDVLVIVVLSVGYCTSRRKNEERRWKNEERGWKNGEWNSRSICFLLVPLVDDKFLP